VVASVLRGHAGLLRICARSAGKTGVIRVVRCLARRERVVLEKSLQFLGQRSQFGGLNGLQQARGVKLERVHNQHQPDCTYLTLKQSLALRTTLRSNRNWCCDSSRSRTCSIEKCQISISRRRRWKKSRAAKLPLMAPLGDWAHLPETTA